MVLRIRRRGKLLVALALVCGLIFSVAGCGGGGANKTAGKTTPSKTAAAPGGVAQGKAFFKGKTINLLVGYAPGGGFDLYARMVGTYMEKYLPGSTVLVRNVPGAGSLVMMDQLYQSKPDGLTIAIIDGTGSTTAQLTQQKGVQFDLSKLSWIGRVSSDVMVLAANPKAYKNIQSMISSKQPIKYDAQGVGSTPYVLGHIFAKALGLNMKMILGASGSHASIANVIQGTSEATTISYESLRPHIDSHQVVPIVQLGKEKEPALPNVPMAIDLTKSQEGKDLINSFVNVIEVGRCFAGPPGIPADRLAALRDAFQAALHDPDLLAQCKKSHRDIKPLTGEQMVAQVKEALSMPPDLVAFLKTLMKSS